MAVHRTNAEIRACGRAQPALGNIKRLIDVMQDEELARCMREKGYLLDAA